MTDVMFVEAGQAVHAPIVARGRPHWITDLWIGRALQVGISEWKCGPHKSIRPRVWSGASGTFGRISALMI
jgi:hypothetical protein